MDNKGHGSCKPCICKLIPQFVPECHQEKKIVTAQAKSLKISETKSEAEKYPISDSKGKDPEVEIRSDGGVECYRCTYYVQGEFEILKEICSTSFFFQVHSKLACTLLDPMSQ